MSIEQTVHAIAQGSRLRSERKRLRLTQQELAARCGFAKLSQLEYELGRRSPNAIYLIAADGCGVDVLFVLTGRRTAAPNRLDPLVELANALSYVIRTARAAGISNACLARVVQANIDQLEAGDAG